MTTHDVEHNKQPRARRQLCAALAVIVLGTFAAACNGDEDPEPIAAADAAILVSFDGATCSWEGATLIELGTVDISVTNSAEVDVFFAGFSMSEPAFSEELQQLPVGTDMEVVNQREVFPGEMVFGWWVSPAEPVTRGSLLPAGVYLFDCLTGGPFDRVWRAAQVEVVAP